MSAQGRVGVVSGQGVDGQTQTAMASAIGTAFRGPNGQALYTLLETAGEQWGVTRADGETSLIDVEAAGNYGANRAGAMAMGEVAGQPLTPDEVTMLAAQLTALSWLLRADETDAWEQLDDRMEHPPEFVEGMQQRAVDQFMDPAAPYLFTLEHPDAPELPADATPAEVAIHRLMYGPYAPGPVDGPWYSGLPEMAAVARELVVPDPSAVFGDDATWWGATLEVLGVVPFGALAKLATAADAFDALNDLRRATTAVEGGQSVEHAADVVDDMVPSVDLDATDGATIADEADADAIEGVDEGDASAGEAADDDSSEGATGSDDAVGEPDADAGDVDDASSADGQSSADQTESRGDDSAEGASDSDASDPTGGADPSDVLPGGSLAANESAGGHTISRHVDQSDADLIDRVEGPGYARESSSFTDLTTAEATISDVIRTNEGAIDSWLEGTDRTLRLEGDGSAVVGRYVGPGASSPVDVTGVRVILVRDPSMSEGFRILTAFPQP